MTTEVLMNMQGTIFWSEQAARDYYGNRFDTTPLMNVTVDYNGNVVNV